MAQYQKNFDVKLRIIYPRLTKNMSSFDKNIIETKANFKYTPQAPVPYAAAIHKNTEVDETSVAETRQQLLDELADLSNSFGRLAEKAGEELKDIAFSYDTTKTENEQYVDAEEGLFGIATGKITYDMYDRIYKYSQDINKEMQRRLIQNGGVLDNVA